MWWVWPGTVTTQAVVVASSECVRLKHGMDYENGIQKWKQNMESEYGNENHVIHT